MDTEFDFLSHNINLINKVNSKNIESFYHSFFFLLRSINPFFKYKKYQKKNFDELVALLNSTNKMYDVIILGETWLNVNLNFHLNGYKSFNSFAVLNKSDGVTIIIKDKFNIISVKDHCISNYNGLEIKFEFNNIFYYCTGIYGSPCVDQISFITSL